jgi:putative membrane protein
MISQILLAILIGTTLGVFTGLIPGIHINLVSIFILTLSPIFLNYTSTLIISIIIISMAVTHTFLDTIPSIFLGAPEEETALSVLPGHKLLLQGKGYEAVMLTLIGSLASIILALSLTPILITGINIAYPIIKKYIGYILLVTVIFLILKEKKSRLWALSIFLISGVLGLTVLNLQSLKEPLFPLLSGLFGTSMLFLSFNKNTKIPKQQISEINIKQETGIKVIFLSVIAGIICSFMPGLGPAQAAIIASQFIKKLGSKSFLILVGGLNTVNMVMSFITLYTLQRSRNGAILTVSKIIENFNLNYLIIFLACSLIVAGISTIIAINITKIFSTLITKINYKYLCISIISIIILLVLVISGFLGILVLTISTFTGIIPQIKGIGRNHMMGCLLLPIMLYFLI